MNRSSRREFLGRGSLAVLGVGALSLRADAATTPSILHGSDHADIVGSLAPVQGRADAQGRRLKPTESDILGPYFRPGTPYIAKVTPPLAEGNIIMIRGRVWGIDTKKSLVGACIHIWQADCNGRYDNDDPKNPPNPGVFAYRTRVVTDEQGCYQFESVHPGRYKIGPDRWRPSHIHYKIVAPGYQTLVTQLYFKGDPMNKSDRFIKKSLIVDMQTVQVEERGRYQKGVFDIVLAKA